MLVIKKKTMSTSTASHLQLFRFRFPAAAGVHPEINLPRGQLEDACGWSKAAVDSVVGVLRFFFFFFIEGSCFLGFFQLFSNLTHCECVAPRVVWFMALLHTKVTANGRGQDHSQHGQTNHDHNLLLQMFNHPVNS